MSEVHFSWECWDCLGNVLEGALVTSQHLFEIQNSWRPTNGRKMT